MGKIITTNVIPEFKMVPTYKHTIKNKTPKDIIVIHGTGGGTVDGCISSFTPNGVSVPFVIDRMGVIYKLYDEGFDHWHAGGNFRDISVRSIGIEMVNWNILTSKGGKFYNWVNGVITPDQVLSVDRVWRGSKYFHKVTDKQMASLSILLTYLCDKYNIPKSFYRQYDVKMVKDPKFKGIVMHSTFHPEKVDFHPQVLPTISI